MSQRPIIEIKNFTKKFKDFVAVDNASFVVKTGSIHGFIGPNGSGKTTTIKTIIGAYTNNDKNVLIDGYLAGTVKANELIGYIPERAAFPSYLNTFQYLMQMAIISGVKKEQARVLITNKLMELDLWEQRKRNPNKFSSGMQKKIMLIQALLTNPKILILDEPAANLDPNARKELFDTLFKLKNEGRTIFISSHILSELERIVDSVTFIYYGQILYSGTVDFLLNNKMDLFIKTSNNFKTIELLKNNNINDVFLYNEEIVIKNINRSIKNMIIDLLNKNFISIEFLKTTDLHTIYNEFVAKQKGLKDANI